MAQIKFEIFVSQFRPAYYNIHTVTWADQNEKYVDKIRLYYLITA